MRRTDTKARLEALESRIQTICEIEIDPLSRSLYEFENSLKSIADPAATAADLGLIEEQFDLMRQHYRRYRRIIWTKIK